MSLKTNRRKRTIVVVLITTMNALFLVLMFTDFDKNSNAFVQTKRSLHSAEVAIGVDLLPLFPELTNVPLNDLEPVLLTQRRKMRKKLVVGIPVVERERNYILETLTSLLGELDEFHRKDILFLVMFGCRQSSSDFVVNTTASIRRKFAKDIDDGLLQGTRDNPLAKVNSTMKYRSGYEPERGYANNNAIWFQNVVKGGRMIVTFSPPITITELTSYIMFSTTECPAHLAVFTFSSTY
ncbi:hypothetical protein Q1695_003076 [Nippostrongylus brasiliensis]|nr:hypothetical protein Q1695_003076 [Nippostrongylus brasiliensis]